MEQLEPGHGFAYFPEAHEGQFAADGLLLALEVEEDGDGAEGDEEDDGRIDGQQSYHGAGELLLMLPVVGVALAVEVRQVCVQVFVVEAQQVLGRAVLQQEVVGQLLYCLGEGSGVAELLQRVHDRHSKREHPVRSVAVAGVEVDAPGELHHAHIQLPQLR